MMEDQKIVELYWNRDETAISETKNKYSNYCFTIANNILHNRKIPKKRSTIPGWRPGMPCLRIIR